MSDKNAVLEARVKAVNTCNARAMELAKNLIEFFTPLVGTKILKGGKSIVAKYSDTVSVLIAQVPDVHCWKNTSEYSLAWGVRASCQVEGAEHSVSHETTIYIGKLNGFILESVESVDILRTDYSAEKVRELRANYALAKKAESAARSALFPFGEFDR